MAIQVIIDLTGSLIRLFRLTEPGVTVRTLMQDPITGNYTGEVIDSAKKALSSTLLDTSGLPQGLQCGLTVLPNRDDTYECRHCFVRISGQDANSTFHPSWALDPDTDRIQVVQRRCWFTVLGNRLDLHADHHGMFGCEVNLEGAPLALQESEETSWWDTPDPL